MTQEPLPLVGKFVVLERLHHGRYHDSFLAADADGHAVVLRRLKPPAASDEDSGTEPGGIGLATAFVAVARINARLKHVAIARVLEYGTPDEPYMAREYLSGRDLRDLKRRYALRHRRIPQSIILYVLTAVSSALAHAHRVAEDDESLAPYIFHGNLCLQDILLGFDGRVQLINFLSSHWHALAEELDQAPKSDFGSPEQAAGQDGDARSDMFSLGVIAYELLTDRPPFPDGRSTAPAAPSSIDSTISPRLDAIVLKMIALNPDQRYESASELEQQLAELCATGEVHCGSKDELAALMKQAFPNARRIERVRARKVTAVTRELSPVSRRKRRSSGLVPTRLAPDQRNVGQAGKTPTSEVSPAERGAAGPSSSWVHGTQITGTLLLILAFALVFLAGTVFYWLVASDENRDETPAPVAAAASPLPARGTGLLIVTSDVPVALSIDDQPQRITPPLERELTPGKHNVTIIFPSTKKLLRREVTIPEGETVRIRLVQDALPAKSR